MDSEPSRFQLSRFVPSFIRSSFRTKLFLAFLLLGALASTGTTLYIGRLLRRVQVVEAQSMMFATVVQMAKALDPDAIARLSAQEDPRDDPEFAAQRKILIDMRSTIVRAVDDINGAETADDVLVDLYVLVRTDREGWGRFAVTFAEDQAGLEYDMSRFPRMMEGWDGATVESGVVTDEYSSSLSAYAPVRDANGVTVGLVGIDAAGVYFYEIFMKTLAIAAGMLAAAIAFSLLFAWLVSRFMSRSLGRLASGMGEVADGRLDTSLLPFGNNDEFDRVIGQFNTMVSGLRDRDALERDLGEAAVVQSGLLPAAAPEIPGFSIAGGIRYCQQAGGDYYDYIRLQRLIDGDSRQGMWGIVVGDVTGHGVGSALVMCSSRAVLRSAAWREPADVSSVMRSVNEHLCHDSPATTFMTMFYGVLDAERGRLSWASAGHEPGLLVRATDGKTARLDSTDIPLGIMAEAEFIAGRAIDFAPGDVLVVGTDGITQARDHTGEFFGFERISDVVRANATSSASEIRDAIFEATNLYRGGGVPDDDVTLVVIKREPV